MYVVIPGFLCSEYQSLDRHLDQLAAYLTVMESRSDRLTHDARQLLQEVRGARQNGMEAQTEPDAAKEQ